MKISNKATNIIAAVLLTAMFFVALFSMMQDALTYDELAHISAGYSYLTQQDYRINPEHPPLAKDILALPLLFLDLNFNEASQSWQQSEAAPAWWVQFNLGKEFIYGSDNNPREIIFWSRLMMIFLTIFLGWLIFWWTKKTAGRATALGALTLFSFSPTILAHGRLTNTDIGAILGSFLATIFWLKFLKNPSKKNTLLAGVFFGVAMLLKFSLALLIPFFAIITIIYAWFFRRKMIEYIGKSIIAGLTGFLLIICPVYQFHIWNYPADNQLRDTIADISNHPITPAKDLTIWMTGHEPLRAPAQYFRGLLMASQRTAWGNTTYYLGEISADSYWHYFPLLLLLKVPLTFHALALLALILLFITFRRKREEFRLSEKNFWIVAFLFWLAIYWTATIVGNLNIGIRHLLPVFPFIHILTVFCLFQGLKIISWPKTKIAVKSLAVLFFAGYIFTAFSVFPHYISYYNYLAGGTSNGYKIAVDSNYDWGQDFYHLLDFVNSHNIEKIHLDYFGGESPEYWLGDKYSRLEPKEISQKIANGLTLKEAGIEGWVAVSLNQFMGGIAEPSPGFDQETGYYNWLNEHQPEARAGESILIYNISD